MNHIATLLLSLIASFGGFFHHTLGAAVTIINGSDTITNSRSVINTNFSNLNASIVGTSSTLSAGQVLYATGVNTMAGVATTSLTGTSITVAGTGSVVGGAGLTVNLNLSNANTWSALQTFSYASTTGISGSYASSTLGYFGTLTIPALGTAAGNFLAVNPSGQVIATTTPVSGGGGTTVSSSYASSTSSYIQTTPLSVATGDKIEMWATANRVGCVSTGVVDATLAFWSSAAGATTTIDTAENGSQAASGHSCNVTQIGYMTATTSGTVIVSNTGTNSSTIYILAHVLH